MLKPAEQAHPIENLDSKNKPDTKQAQVETEKLVAVGVAENEGLPVVGLGDEKQA